MSAIKVGDVVKLMSSSAQMTVEKVQKPEIGSEINEWCQCVYFLDGKFWRDSFPVEALAVVVPKVIAP